MAQRRRWTDPVSSKQTSRICAQYCLEGNVGMWMTVFDYCENLGHAKKMIKQHAEGFKAGKVRAYRIVRVKSIEEIFSV